MQTIPQRLIFHANLPQAQVGFASPPGGDDAAAVPPVAAALRAAVGRAALRHDWVRGARVRTRNGAAGRARRESGPGVGHRPRQDARGRRGGTEAFGECGIATSPNKVEAESGRTLVCFPSHVHTLS